jgi:hypothetical protein
MRRGSSHNLEGPYEERQHVKLRLRAFNYNILMSSGLRMKCELRTVRSRLSYQICKNLIDSKLHKKNQSATG